MDKVQLLIVALVYNVTNRTLRTERQRKMALHTNGHTEQANSVGIVARYGLDYRGSIRRLFSTASKSALVPTEIPA
jgi:hypothetical protein